MSKHTKKRNIFLTIIIVLIIFSTAAVLVIVTISYQNQSSGSKNNYSADEVLSDVITKMNYQNLSPISTENIRKYYELPDNTVSDSSMYISSSSDISTELACFKLRSDVDENVLDDIINEYLESKTGAYKELTEKNIQPKTSVDYPYVFVVISSDSETAVSVFESIIDNTDS